MIKLDKNEDGFFETFFGDKTPEEKAKYKKTMNKVRSDMDKEESDHKDCMSKMNGSIVAMGISASLMGGLIGGMGKMFGKEGHEFKEFIVATIDGFMMYIEEKSEEIKRLTGKLEEKNEEADKYKERYEDMEAIARENKETVVALTAELVMLKGNELAKEKKKKKGKKRGPKPKKKAKKK